VLARQFAQHEPEVARQPGVIQGLAEPLGSAARAHVKTVRDIAGAQREAAQAADIAGVSRPFETVHHNDLANRLPFRELRVDEHLNRGFRAVEPRAQWEPLFFTVPAPQVTGDGLKMGVPEKGIKGDHETAVQSTLEHA
jgi:hypothetical protein